MLPGVEYRLWQRLGVPLLLLATTWLTLRCVYAGTGPALDAAAAVQDSAASSSLDVSCHSRRLVLVSTLDGRISAIDTSRAFRAGGGGALLWTLSPSDAPMLQSTLTQNMRLSQQGQWVRLVPALDGSLFKFDGEHVEPLPVTADMLLQTSHRLLDDTVISGSREVVTLGVELDTGRVRYRCTAAGCWHRQKTSAELLEEDGDSDEQQLLVLKLLTQTVRAMEPLSGVERWNFSVTQHEASIASASSAPPVVLASSCSGQLTAELADGLVSGVHRGRRWSHRFDTPLVHVWRLSGDVLEEVDMLTETAPSVARGQSALPRPLLYLGMHEQQMYIQQSRRARGSPVASEASAGAVVRWRPYMVSASSRTPVIYGTTPAASVRDNPLLLAADASSTTSATVFGTSALALRPEEYPFEGGYYLYSTDCRLDEQQQQGSQQSLPPNESLPPLQDIDDGVLYVVVDSLGYWWPHILLLSVSIALLMNAMITQHFRMYYRAKAAQAMQQFLRLNMPRLVVKEVAVPVPQEVIREVEVVREVEVLRDPAPVRSRFLLEFEPLQCLGRGGFGVVFEARNRLDSQHYAVKRISLPGRERARRKVLREVSCLAKLEHVNIVRYFYCWTEQLSPACLQEQDRVIQGSELAWASRTPLNSMCSDVPSTCLVGSELSAGVRRVAEFDSAPPDVRSADSWRRRTVAGGVLASVDEMAELPTAGAGDSSWDDSAVVFSTGVIANGAGGDSVRNGVRQTLDSSSGVFSRQVSKESSTPTPGSSLVRSFLAGGGEDSSDDEDHKDFAVKKLDESQDDSVVFSADSAMPAMDYTLPDVDPFSDDSDSSCGPVVAFQSRRGGSSGELSEDGAGEVFLFIQVQLCRKESLKDWLAAGGPLVRDRSQVLVIFLQILTGVEYVHGQGLMHRDLKPSNIFFALDGVVKIGDFGLATGRSLCDTTTFSDTVVDLDVSGQHTDQVGTRLYMSPEQTAGVGSDYDYRVDIYALGIVLLELLVPFDTQMERLATLTAVRRGLLPPEFRSRCPDEAELVAAMLSHQPARRPSIAEIRRRCQRLMRTDTTDDVGPC